MNPLVTVKYVVRKEEHGVWHWANVQGRISSLDDACKYDSDHSAKMAMMRFKRIYPDGKYSIVRMTSSISFEEL